MWLFNKGLVEAHEYNTVCALQSKGRKGYPKLGALRGVYVCNTHVCMYYVLIKDICICVLHNISHLVDFRLRLIFCGARLPRVKHGKSNPT